MKKLIINYISEHMKGYMDIQKRTHGEVLHPGEA